VNGLSDERVLSHFSLPRHHPIEDRIRLAGANGFTGIGLYVSHYQQLELDGEAPGRVRELLTQHGVALREIEVIPGLGADGPGGNDAADREAVAFRMADEFGCRYLQVIGPAGDDLAGAAMAFGKLCDRAADHGLVVGLEFLPFTDVVDVHDARRIVEAADRPNGGICVDVWHHERGARDLAAIASLPGELITGIQINDGTRVPEGDDYYTDCLANRRAPGDGEFELAAFLAAVRDTGTTAPLSFEVCSTTGWADPETHIRRIASGAGRLP
jgi:sugar phosphate isomerase/epimerase